MKVADPGLVAIHDNCSPLGQSAVLFKMLVDVVVTFKHVDDFTPIFDIAEKNHVTPE